MPEKFSQMFPVLGAIAAFLLAAFLLLLIFRLLFGRKIRAPGPRNRPRRLDIVDVFDVDRERQLVIVRRDNIEHLLLIGGPNDVLVESAIHRVEGQLGRPAEQRAPQPASGWPAGPAAPREAEAPKPLPPDLFAPAPKPAPAPPARPAGAPAPTQPAAAPPMSPPLPPRPAPPRAPTPPFLARAQRAVQGAPKEPPPAAPEPPPPPAAPVSRPPAPEAAKPKPPAAPIAAPAPIRPPAPEAAALKPKAPPPPPQAAPAPRPAPKAPEPPPAASQPAPAENDPLDSLEAEMARLLGRPDGE